MSPLTPRAKNLALALLAMTQFVIVIDASIVNVALPSIGAHLHFSRDDLTWVVNAYTLTFGGFLLLGGRKADLLGRRRMFMLGLVVFSLASLAGGLAQSETWLITARAAQGLGAAIVSPAALSIITTTFASLASPTTAGGYDGIRFKACFSATAGRMRLFPGLPSSEGRRRGPTTTGASPVFATSRALLGSPTVVRSGLVRATSVMPGGELGWRSRWMVRRRRVAFGHGARPVGCSRRY